MAEKQHLSKEEKIQIEEIKNSSQQKVFEFGQIELEIILCDQRMDFLNQEKERLTNQYKELQTKEESLVNSITKKYGTGTLNIESGEFLPSIWVFGNVSGYL